MTETIILIITIVLAALAIMACASYADIGRLYRRIEELERLVVVMGTTGTTGTAETAESALFVADGDGRLLMASPSAGPQRESYSYTEGGKVHTVYPDARMEVEQEPGPFSPESEIKERVDWYDAIPYNESVVSERLAMLRKSLVDADESAPTDDAWTVGGGLA